MNILCWAVAGVLVFFIIWMLIEGQRYRIRRISIENKKIPDTFHNFKILFISDIHYGRFFKPQRLIEIVKEINRMESDIIVLGGDYLDIPVKSKKDMSKYVEDEFQVLKELKAKRGIYAVLGNHDYFQGKSLLRKEIEQSSFVLLCNKKEKIYVGKECIELIGMDDLLEGKPEKELLKNEKESFTIAISHNPDFYSDFKREIQYDLGLAGHTHGGQVTFCGLFAPYTSSKYGQRYVKGRVFEKDRTIIISNGIGNGALPIRFFAMPDIIQITLKRERKNI